MQKNESIVSALFDLAEGWPGTIMGAVAREAAMEIERYRSTLAEIANTDPDDGTQWFHDIANKALGADE